MNHQQSTEQSSILIAAGGTGGDLFPAIAIVEELEKLIPNLRVEFTGSPDRIESRYLPKYGFSFTPLLSLKGFRGISSSLLKVPLIIISALLEIRALVQQSKPTCIICGGNYISLPAGIYAILSGIPLIIIEPNVRPGKTNALLGSYAKLIIAAFEETALYFKTSIRSHIAHCGNPLRSTFVSIIPTRESAASVFGLDPRKQTVFVFGGSLGARSINQALIKCIDRLAEHGIQILWQTGTDFILNRELPKDVHVMQFIDDMPLAYASADLIVSRAGGGTVAELAVCGKPAILIPLPGSANNEQSQNAEALHQHGAAIVIEDAALSTELEYAIEHLLKHPEKLSEMSLNALKHGKPHAAKEAAALIATFLK